jgi:hypothetical protein
MATQTSDCPVQRPAVDLEVLFRGRYLSVTTFRRDGSGVATPVWFASDARRPFALTDLHSAKVGRIRRNPRVLVESCRVDGKLPSEPVPGARGGAHRHPGIGAGAEASDRALQDLVPPRDVDLPARTPSTRPAQPADGAALRAPTRGRRECRKQRACSTAAAIATPLAGGRRPRRLRNEPSQGRLRVGSPSSKRGSEQRQQRARQQRGTPTTGTHLRRRCAVYTYTLPRKRMSRKSRNRSRPGTAKNMGSRAEPRDRMARVQVSDDVWADFRAAAGNRPSARSLAAW